MKTALSEIYKTSLVNLTDLYQLTMSYGYWSLGTHETEAVFHLFYRKPPFGSHHVIAAGLGYVQDLLSNFEYSKSDCDYLAGMKDNQGNQLFDPKFVSYLRRMEMTCVVDAVPEGKMVYPHEPLIRIRGPIIQCQLLETVLLNIVNFQSLIATKAARIVEAAQGDQVVEFGLRRAQGIDGGLAASRAAYLGGCTATSNVLAGQLFGIPVVGTHAHSWVMSFPSELEAFRAYAKSQPGNCILLVDTYDPVQGIKNAITVGQELKTSGHKLNGIRLDSGDLAALSIQARQMLDEAGLSDAKIVASNDLDECKIARLKSLGAKVDVWGVGTCLVTGSDQPALGGVYKLGAIKRNDQWVSCMKFSADVEKRTNPGILEIYRSDKDRADIICNHNCSDPSITEGSNYQKLLQPIETFDSEFQRLERARTRANKVVQERISFRENAEYNVSIHPTLAEEKKKMDAVNIEILSGLEPVRRRPTMYFGPKESIHYQMLQEFLCLARERAQCQETKVDITLYSLGRCKIAFTGALGVLESLYKKMCEVELMMTVLHACKKAKNDADRKEFCMVGIAPANAMSSDLEVIVITPENERYFQFYSRGKPTSKMEKSKLPPEEEPDTTVFRWQVDGTILPDAVYDFDRVVDWCRANLEKISCTIRDACSGKKVEFRNENL